LKAILEFVEDSFALISHLLAEIAQIDGEKDRVYHFFEFSFISFQPYSLALMMILCTSLIKRVIFISCTKARTCILWSIFGFALWNL